jgi:hypothetical protein
VRDSKIDELMSALGQKQTLTEVCAMSVIPPKADIECALRNVRFVPKVETGQGYSITSSAMASKPRGNVMRSGRCFEL